MTQNQQHQVIGILPEFSNENFDFIAPNETVQTQLSNLKQISFNKAPVYITEIILFNKKTSVAIKVFKKPYAFTRWFDSRFRGGIRPLRTWNASCFCYLNNIPTPKPIALLYNAQNNCYYYLSYYQNSSCFRDELSHIFWRSYDNSVLIDLLRYVATNIRNMHDKGFFHGDLGNQNILLNSNEKEFYNLVFVGLDRVKTHKELSLKQRAKDFSRIKLPSEYMSIFKYIYFNDEEQPTQFDSYISKYQKRYKRHRKLYYFRHPLKYNLRHHISSNAQPVYPKDNNIWIWDNKTSQAMVILKKKERNYYKSYPYFWGMLLQTLFSGLKLYREYKSVFKLSYVKPVNLADRLIISLHNELDYFDVEEKLLDELQCTNVLLRFCHHESQTIWSQSIDHINKLHKKGIKISIALLQSRKAITNPESWSDFVTFVLPPIVDKIEYVEVGHAINRVKWGIWHINEYISLYKPLLEIKEQYPHLNLVGPAIIDFEWPRLLDALKNIPKSLRLYGASVHLYVDRRGAPENKQNGFSTLEKCVLNKAICNLSPRTEKRFIISETNWPLKNTGTHSPIAASYLTPNCRLANSGVFETEYASYMIRFIVIALCSGHVDSICWWRLSAHGYGLVDDKNGWQKRPSFFAIKTFNRLLGKSTFVQKLPSCDENYLFLFRCDHAEILLTWTIKQENSVDIGFVVGTQVSLYGEEQSLDSKTHITLTQQPSYYFVSN